MTPEINDVEELVRAAAEQAAARAEEKGIQIWILPMEEAAGAETGDYVEIVKLEEQSTAVSIGIDSYEMFRCVRIADQGVGIAEEELPKVFGRFYRGQNVRQESGVGIGLYLARQIVEGQGGYIQAESEPGKGSAFRVFLPV